MLIEYPAEYLMKIKAQKRPKDKPNMSLWKAMTTYIDDKYHMQQLTKEPPMMQTTLIDMMNYQTSIVQQKLETLQENGMKLLKFVNKLTKRLKLLETRSAHQPIE
jgi:hypothetical protein